MKFIPVSDCNETNWRIGVDELGDILVDPSAL